MPPTCNGERQMSFTWWKIYWQTYYIGTVDEGSHTATQGCQFAIAAS